MGDTGRIVGFEHIFDVMRYPAGESHVEVKRVLPFSNQVIQASHVRNFEDLLNCVTAQRILKHNGFSGRWFIPYFPFGRHDRRRSHLDGLELELALEIAKELNPVTLDPHSDVLGQMKHIPQSEVVRYWETLDLVEGKENPLFVIPDQGATKKAYTWLNGRPSVQGLKHRDTATGELSGFGVDNPDAVGGQDCIIVDDICDGGGTFLGLADVLLECGAASLTLAVTHGLFTKGTDILFEKFDRIFSTGPHQTDGVIRAKHHRLFGTSVKV